MACVCSLHKARSDWLILGRYSPVMPTDRLRTCKRKAYCQIINKLLTSNVRFVRENLEPYSSVNMARSRFEVLP